MKIWFGYGSEHSMNLVMIGRFKEVRDAEMAAELIERLTEKVIAESGTYAHDSGPQDRRFSDAMLELLRETRLYTVNPSDLEQFEYDARVELKGNDVVVTTDEVDVSSFLKVFLEKGARVEIFSAHDYPGTGHGR